MCVGSYANNMGVNQFAGAASYAANNMCGGSYGNELFSSAAAQPASAFQHASFNFNNAAAYQPQASAFGLNNLNNCGNV